MEFAGYQHEWPTSSVGHSGTECPASLYKEQDLIASESRQRMHSPGGRRPSINNTPSARSVPKEARYQCPIVTPSLPQTQMPSLSVAMPPRVSILEHHPRRSYGVTLPHQATSCNLYRLTPNMTVLGHRDIKSTSAQAVTTSHQPRIIPRPGHRSARSCAATSHNSTQLNPNGIIV